MKANRLGQDQWVKLGPVGLEWCSTQQRLLSEGLRKWDRLGRAVHIPPSAGSTPSLVGICECTWEIIKNPSLCPQELSSQLMGRPGLEAGKACVMSSSREYGFSQNEEAPPCPHRNYSEEVMQTFEREQGTKKTDRKKRFICLCRETCRKIQVPFSCLFVFFSLSSSTMAAALIGS